jgi:hypothetical protein
VGLAVLVFATCAVWKCHLGRMHALLACGLANYPQSMRVMLLSSFSPPLLLWGH